ncbi:MAG TPA: GIY-YIG nuclease family protein [Candidatus Dojkabacteria bacterium]|nr:GIY-YIG nuclease family protein [Candidatus Dojkabacteria bacterium]HRO64999.1 GIY-YIG nuclease family protein [Candidatus Dojkabacteria bacterium]HRP51835.1 GIY-YIG nuclease family protein [Candidatus Dojkabacteria bacterium]
MKTYFVYITTNRKRGVLYIGVTNDLVRRIYEHKHKIKCKFSARYNVNKLVYYEIHFRAMSAIHREKRLKEWKRDWKIELIERSNPLWEDLYESISC